MSMSVSSCTSRIDNGYEKYKEDIFSDFNKQKNQFDQQEEKRKKEYESKQSSVSEFGQTVGIKSSIPGANNVKIKEEFIPNNFQFNSGIKHFFQVIADELDVEFQNAVPSMTNVDISPPSGTLTYVPQDDVVQNAYEIAKKTSAYWALTITPTGTPVAGTIVSVSNTAASIINPLASEILSIASSDSTGTYKKLIETIIKHVKTIMWTVTELDKEQKPVIFTVTVN